ncbi:MAG TPA: S8 family serine peptidase, partial [Syntrophales bacterium]|nr:S8 family serine peptidase [Syntrophales bacterium]
NNGGADWTTLFDLSDWYLYYNYWGWAADVIVIPDSFKTANFRFRFHFISDSDDNDPGSDDAGWVIDDVAIGTALTKGYGYKSGTSMATPHVAGAVGLLAAKRPNESVAMRKNRILRNVDKIPALSGKTVTGGRLNIEKAINAASGSLPAVNFLLMQ